MRSRTSFFSTRYLNKSDKMTWFSSSSGTITLIWSQFSSSQDHASTGQGSQVSRSRRACQTLRIEFNPLIVDIENPVVIRSQHQLSSSGCNIVIENANVQLQVTDGHRDVQLGRSLTEHRQMSIQLPNHQQHHGFKCSTRVFDIIGAQPALALHCGVKQVHCHMSKARAYLSVKFKALCPYIR